MPPPMRPPLAPSAIPERLAQLLPEFPAEPIFGRWRRLDLRQLLEQSPLLRRELRGRPDVHPYVQVAAATFAEPRQSLSLPAVHGSRLRPRVRLEGGGDVRRWDLNVRAERGVGEREWEVVDQIIAVALEARVVGDLQHGDQVPRRPVAGARHALAAHRQVVMLLDAGRDVDLDCLFGAHAPVALALGARLADHAALSRTARARRHGHELAEHGAGGAAYLARAPAGAAGRRAGPVRGARPPARGAPVQGAQPHGLRGTFRDLVERQLERDLQVLPPLAVAPRALAAAEEGVQSAQAAEVAHENVERLGEVEVCEAEPAARRARPAHARHAVPIVGGALLGITQHFVRLRDLLELLFGRRLLLGSDAVGMMLHGQAAVGLLDLRLARVPRHAQQRVVVARPAHSSSSPTRRLVWSTSATILS